jgi:hypothetical protein
MALQGLLLQCRAEIRTAWVSLGLQQSETFWNTRNEKFQKTLLNNMLEVIMGFLKSEWARV